MVINGVRSWDQLNSEYISVEKYVSGGGDVSTFYKGIPGFNGGLHGKDVEKKQEKADFSIQNGGGGVGSSHFSTSFDNLDAFVKSCSPEQLAYISAQIGKGYDNGLGRSFPSSSAVVEGEGGNGNGLAQSSSSLSVVVEGQGDDVNSLMQTSSSSSVGVEGLGDQVVEKDNSRALSSENSSSSSREDSESGDDGGTNSSKGGAKRDRPTSPPKSGSPFKKNKHSKKN